jgi:phosphate transport system substrate-binding protein
VKKITVLVLIGLLALSVVSFAAVKGNITIAGSTSVQPLAEELAQAFMAKNKKVKIFVQGGGSGAGIKAAMSGTANIGTSSRELNPDEQGLRETIIAWDGIAIIVNKTNSVADLKLDQIQKIYSGEYTNWKEVGGPDQKIVVINREAGSGTRGAFEEIVLGKVKNTPNCLVQASTGAVQQSVAITKEAIGYISLGALDEKAVKAVKVNSVLCNEANIKNKSYRIQRPFLMLTKSAPTGVVKAFLDYILSPEGQKIVAKDYITVAEEKKK